MSICKEDVRSLQHSTELQSMRANRQSMHLFCADEYQYVPLLSTVVDEFTGFSDNDFADITAIFSTCPLIAPAHMSARVAPPKAVSNVNRFNPITRECSAKYTSDMKSDFVDGKGNSLRLPSIFGRDSHHTALPPSPESALSSLDTPSLLPTNLPPGFNALPSFSQFGSHFPALKA
ncbi:hypothetical protein BCR33DRAFT_720688 [Rhizoclosmatium globosum]|uniref:Uncharacterized protein n=1 Tax=Rhizoclosmatium globosum TaxID=329046 RepID=A0A1Y2BVA3_9FUNG|nr:hypothetical protein BCR33DRAFT_720688 [Rhizoclosmatium globosum]|eukprot:ORY38702.1 hypothetical protein BCR33DRAFT_720688 [Rhizoclosmatium globosum]